MGGGGGGGGGGFGGRAFGGGGNSYVAVDVGAAGAAWLSRGTDAQPAELRLPLPPDMQNERRAAGGGSAAGGGGAGEVPPPPLPPLPPQEAALLHDLGRRRALSRRAVRTWSHFHIWL